MNPNGHYTQATVEIPDHLQAPLDPPRQDRVEIGINIKLNALSLWMKILNARLLALISLAGCLVGFTFTMYDPQPLRLWGLGIYAILCVWPVMWLHLKKG